jgi:hypothetical protein
MTIALHKRVAALKSRVWIERAKGQREAVHPFLEALEQSFDRPLGGPGQIVRALTLAIEVWKAALDANQGSGHARPAAFDSAIYAGKQRAGGDAESNRDLGAVRANKLGGGGRRGGAHISDEVGDGEVCLVADG